MSVFKLYKRLKQKGYRNPAVDRAAGELMWMDLKERRLRELLEYDRRAVFQSWYGPGAWVVHFREANDQIIATVIDHAIEYILHAEDSRSG